MLNYFSQHLPDSRDSVKIDDIKWDLKIRKDIPEITTAFGLE
jgi:hypothetical protein